MWLLGTRAIRLTVGGPVVICNRNRERHGTGELATCTRVTEAGEVARRVPPKL